MKNPTDRLDESADKPSGNQAESAGHSARHRQIKSEPTPTSTRSPRLLLVTTVLLAVTGVVLLALPHRPGARVSATVPPPAAPASSPVAVSPAGHPATGSVPAAAAATATASEPAASSALPPHGEGAAGDWAIQRALDDAWPANLPARDERRLLAAGRSLLRADATGTGRNAWPTLFPADAGVVAPAFTRVRIQAAVARRDGGSDRAVVHLVWAASDRGGTYTDGRITEWHFIRTSQKGVPVWTPQPRT